jgi:hypothetical protein
MRTVALSDASLVSGCHCGLLTRIGHAYLIPCESRDMSNVQVICGKIPAEEFALYETLQTLPNVRFEAKRVVQSGEDIIMPLIWVRDVDIKDFEAALNDDSSVREFSLLSSFDDEDLYRMEWISQVELVLQMLAKSFACLPLSDWMRNRFDGRHTALLL